MYLPVLRVHFKRDQQRTYLMMLMQFNAPAIRRVVERAYSVTQSIHLSHPHLALVLCVYKFFRWGHPCPLDTFLIPLDTFLIFFSDFLYKSIFCGYSFELHQQIDAIQMDTHNICFYKKQTKSTLTTELLDCVLIGVCLVIRLNMVSPTL